MATFKPKEIISILKKLKFIEKRQTGSHAIMYNPTIKKIIAVPIHNKDMKKGLLHSIIKDADSSEEEFLKLR